jgi:tetratricopeptide (TPR) repeat protein
MKFFIKLISLFAFLSLGTVLYAQVTEDSKTKEYQYGLYWYKQGQYLKAMAWFRKVIELAPSQSSVPGNTGANHWQTYQMLGNTYYYLGYKAEAVKVYELSLKDNPNNPQLVKLVGSLKVATAVTPTPTPAYHDTPPEPAWVIPGADEEGANQIHDLPVSLLNKK